MGTLSQTIKDVKSVWMYGKPTKKLKLARFLYTHR